VFRSSRDGAPQLVHRLGVHQRGKVTQHFSASTSLRMWILGTSRDARRGKIGPHALPIVDKAYRLIQGPKAEPHIPLMLHRLYSMGLFLAHGPPTRLAAGICKPS
jgi:hypothetical protein